MVHFSIFFTILELSVIQKRKVFLPTLLVFSLKVFEVNSSSQRSGRQILSQLKEATQSHQVGIQGVNAQKPSYFSNYSNNSTTIKPGNSPSMNVFFLGGNNKMYTLHDFLLEFSVSLPITGKLNSPRRVVSSPRKPPQSPRSASSRRGGLVPTSLANFFKAGGRPTGKEAKSQDKKTQPGNKSKSSNQSQVFPNTNIELILTFIVRHIYK